MEEAPVTAATGALGPVVAKLSALLRRRGEYQLRQGTRKDVKLIRSKLKSIHSILWVIWEREDLDAAGKELRMEAWRLADDMNDAIDDFILSLKRSNDSRCFMQAKIQPSPFQDLKRRAVDMSERCRNKWKMATDQATIFARLFSTTKPTGDDSGPGKRPCKWKMETDISELVVVGTEKPRDKLIKHLVGEEERTLQLKMACIVGAAGMGKTTLARLVYEAIDKDEFEARAFVSITSCHNMTEVLASILQQVAADSPAILLASTKAATKKHLIDLIWNFLKDKRYLVIIDDIWHCGEWETIKKSLPDNNLGSRIVTTSRLNAITDKWRDDFDALVHKIDHSDWHWTFTAQMFDMNAVDGDFDLGHGIVEMCGSMPLAVACMISAMAKERECQEQQGLCVLRTRELQDRIEEKVKRNGIQNTPGFEPLVESLELGYNHLPHHMLKTCLLYCSIYPEDHILLRDHLVIRWIAEGFVCKEEVAKDYYDELVSRGLFQEFQSDDGNYYHYKLQPMMRNYLRWKLREDNFITCTSDGVPSYLVGRLCIDYWPSSDAVDPLSGIDWHHIRSLFVSTDAERVPYKHLKHLRVLDVQYNHDHVLENQHLKDMCGLLRLRHLLLSGGQPKDMCEMLRLSVGCVGSQREDGMISEIPADIGRLKYLETLKVTETKITRLPAEISDLKQLKTLDVSQNQELAELPREMANLQHILETLRIRGANIREQAWEIIGTLKKLKTLDASDNPELSRIPKDIGELQQLKKLYMSENPWITELPKEIGKLQHLETLDASETRITELPREIGNLQRLETLDVRETGITELPREIGNLRRLENLDLGATNITKVPRDIGKLQHLEYLNLRDTNVRKMPREIGGLQNLKYLKGEVGILPLEAGQLSKLERLPKCVRQAWKNSHLVSSLAGEILSFNHNGIFEELINHTKHMHIPQWIKEHFNNIGGLDIRICKLEEHDLKILREMPYLLKLMLRFEVVPRKKIVINSGGFANLRGLTVDSRVPRLTFQEGAMPRLYLLVFEFQFYGAPPNTDPVGIKHLVNLHNVSFRCNEWYAADSPCIGSTIDVVRKEAREHPNKITLEVQGKAKEIFPENSIITQSSEDGSEACSSSGAQEIEEIQA